MKFTFYQFNLKSIRTYEVHILPVKLKYLT